MQLTGSSNGRDAVDIIVASLLIITMEASMYASVLAKSGQRNTCGLRHHAVSSLTPVTPSEARVHLLRQLPMLQSRSMHAAIEDRSHGGMYTLAVKNVWQWSEICSCRVHI